MLSNLACAIINLQFLQRGLIHSSSGPRQRYGFSGQMIFPEKGGRSVSDAANFSSPKERRRILKYLSFIFLLELFNKLSDNST